MQKHYAGTEALQPAQLVGKPANQNDANIRVLLEKPTCQFTTGQAPKIGINHGNITFRRWKRPIHGIIPLPDENFLPENVKDRIIFSEENPAD